MSATFIFERFTKILEIPITANKICSEFDWEPRSFGLLIRSEQPPPGQRHIQPTGGSFSNLKDGATYEIILSPQKCTFTYNEERIEEDVGKATQLYLAERFNLKPETVIINYGNQDILALNGRFRDLKVNQVYKVNGEPYNSSRQLAGNIEQIKIQIRVPGDFIDNLRGSLINNFQNYSHLNRYSDLDNLLENSEATLLPAKDFQSFILKLKDGDTQEGFDTFYTAVIEINKAEHEAFLTADRGLSVMKRELTALPLALLDTIAIPSHFINNREKIRDKMQKAIEEKIETTRVLLEKTIAEIIAALDKPKMLAEKLSDIIHRQVTEEATGKSKATKKHDEIKMTISKLDEDIKAFEELLGDENVKLAQAEEKLRNAKEKKEGWFSKTKDRYKSTENISLFVLNAFLEVYLRTDLPNDDKIDIHKTVYFEDLQEVLKGMDMENRVVSKLHEYTKFLAIVSSSISPDNYIKLQGLRSDLGEAADKGRKLTISYSNGTAKEKACRTADCERRIAEEKISLYKELIRKKKERKIRTEYINRELLEIINSTSTTTRARELSDKICRHLDNIKRLFASIISALKETQGHIKSNLKDKFDSYLSTMNLDVLYTSETDARQQLELWYGDAIQAIGWIVQVATTCNVFGKLYAEVIEPGLDKNSHALFTGTKLNGPMIKAAEIIDSITKEAPGNVATYINDINKPLNVYVKFLTNGEERPQLQVKEPLVEELEEGTESEREI